MQNVHNMTESNRSIEEASSWLASLERGLSDEEQNTLQEWLSADPENPRALMKVAKIWDRMDTLSRLADLFPQSLNQSSGISRPVLTAAATVLLTVLVGVWAAYALFTTAPVSDHLPEYTGSKQVFQTAVGEQSTVNLSDGSKLTLNTNTLISVTYTDQQRMLVLERGEAYVRVAHDEERQLNVYVGNRVVKAMGTAFNIKITQDQKVELIVTEGKVLVVAIDKKASIPSKKARSSTASPDKSMAISSGEKVLMGDSEGEIRQIKPEEIEVELSWRGGNLVFRGESLAEALAEIERYTPVEFVIMDEDLKKLRVVGLFKAGDVEGLLVTLRENFDIGYERVSDERVILTNNK